MLHLKRYHAFSLIELMIVVSIGGVLAATAMSTFAKYKEKGKISGTYFHLDGLKKAQIATFAEEGYLISAISWTHPDSSGGGVEIPLDGVKFPLQVYPGISSEEFASEIAAYYKPLVDVLPTGTESYFAYTIRSSTFRADGAPSSPAFNNGQHVYGYGPGVTTIAVGFSLPTDIENAGVACGYSEDYANLGISQEPGVHVSLLAAASNLSYENCRMVLQLLVITQSSISTSPILEFDVGVVTTIRE